MRWTAWKERLDVPRATADRLVVIGWTSRGDRGFCVQGAGGGTVRSGGTRHRADVVLQLPPMYDDEKSGREIEFPEEAY